MKSAYFDQIHSFGNSKEKSSTNNTYFFSKKTTKAIYLIGNQLTIQQIEKMDTTLQNCPPKKILTQTHQKFFQFDKNTTHFLKKLKNYKIHQFLYNREKKRSILNIHPLDEIPKTNPIIIYTDLQTKKSTKIEIPDLKGIHFKKVHFVKNTNGRYFIALTNKTPQTVFLYDLLKMRILGIGSFNKSDRISDVRVYSDEPLKVYGFSDSYKKIKIIMINDSNFNEEITLNLNLNCGIGFFVMLEKNVFLVSDSKGFNLMVLEIMSKGKIGILQRMNCIDYETDKKVKSLKDENIVFLEVFSKGVILYLSNHVFVVLIYNKVLHSEIRENEKNILVPYSCFEFRDVKEKCVSIDFSEDEEKLLFGFENSPFLSLSMILILKKTDKNQIIRKFGNIQLFRLSTNHNIHYQKKIDLWDISSQKSLAIMSNIETRSIIFYNYITKEIELHHTFKNIINFGNFQYFKIHPNGFFITCAFKKKIIKFSIIHNSLIEETQNKKINDCYLMKYSKNGDYLICCYNKNKMHYNTISILDGFTLKTLKILSNNISTVRDIIFTSLNSYVWCCTDDGVLNKWSLNDFQRFEIYKNNDLRFLQIVKVVKEGRFLKEKLVVLAEDIHRNQFLCFEGEDGIHHFGKIQLFNDLEDFPKFRVTFLQFLDIDGVFKGIVMGNSMGYLSFHEDLKNLKNYSELLFTQISGNIVGFNFIKDLGVLTVFGEEGIFNIYSVREIFQKKSLEGSKIGNNQSVIQSKVELKEKTYKNHIVIPRSYLESQESREKHYLQEIQDLVNKMEIKISEDNRIYQENLKNIVNKYEKELNLKNIELETIKKQKEIIENQSSSLIQKMENQHLNAVEELERVFEQKLINENEKLLNMKKNYYKEKVINKTELDKLNENNKENFEDLKKDVKSELSGIIKNYNYNENEKTKIKKDYDKEILNLQNEHDLIVSQMKSNYESKIDAYKKALISHKNEIKKLKNTNIQLTREMDKISRDMNLEKNKIDLLNNKIEEIECSKYRKDEEIKKNIKKIKENDLIIYELNNKIENLDKTKNYLQYQTDEIAKGIEPKEDLIKKLKNQVQKLKSELNKSIKRIQEKEIKIFRQKDENKGLKVMIKKKDFLISTNSHFTKNICSIIRNCIYSIDPKFWYVEMKKLHNFIEESQNIISKNKFEDKNEQKIGEVMNQINFLQNRIVQSNKEKFKINFYKKKHIKAKTEENTVLINELNLLRKERKNLINQKNTLEMENRLLKNQNNFDMRKRMKKPDHKNNVKKKNKKIVFKSKENKGSNKFVITNFSKNFVDKEKVVNSALLIKDLIYNKAHRKSMIKGMDAQLKSDIIEKLLVARQIK